MADPRPLILTGTLDEPTQSWLDGLRARHFPAERNYLSAHLTLFHALPGADADAVTGDVRAAVDRAPMSATVTGPRLLGRGVAFVVDCPELLELRRELAARWSARLTRQDAGKSDLHVTVQNKVSPDAARALHDDLAAGFEPSGTTVTGLALWRYAGGPWDPGPVAPFSG
ncbi:2'-5' RNA ligase family protein [Pseudonocardia nematodicida]|uniref:2'-5' RNA ligase family protein n=1 Tax=Pseudonocardia nematodicida TaxID=1206997 RepID=A0ABV1KCE5_9PSEU